MRELGRRGGCRLFDVFITADGQVAKCNQMVEGGGLRDGTVMNSYRLFQVCIYSVGFSHSGLWPIMESETVFSISHNQNCN